MASRDTGTVQVDPPVHVERYASHVSVSWTAGDIEQFVVGVEAILRPNVPAVVDATDAAGRQQLELDEIDTAARTTTYVRVEPEQPWTLAWGRRTQPVVTLTGTPDRPTVRRLHVATTDCEQWADAPRFRLGEMLDGV